MSNILIRRKHGKTLGEARVVAEQMISELKDEIDLIYAWEGDVLRFERPGVTGEFSLDAQEAVLSVCLGGLLSVLKPSIESEVNKFFDQNFLSA